MKTVHRNLGARARCPHLALAIAIVLCALMRSISALADEITSTTNTVPTSFSPAKRTPLADEITSATNTGPAVLEETVRAPGPGELRLNFRGAPIELVLNYLSDAAGFIIQLNTPVRGTVDVWSKQPVTQEEAVNLRRCVTVGC